VNVLATQHETFGLVVIEAMAQGIAVIATAKGGPLEIIDDGVDGLLFDGSSEDLSAKIELLCSDVELREQLIEKAQEKVSEKFDKQKQLSELYNVLT
jgi:glycosyltransferase involved in cell wall biosynthesis